MRLWSPAWSNGEPIPEHLAAGRLNADGSVGFSGNRSPELQWSDLPDGTRSLVLLCHDFDVPADRSDANRSDREVAVEAERLEFFHWVLVDVPPAPGGFAEGQWSDGFTIGGKPGPDTPGPARQGLNDFTGWFEGDAQYRGRYHGYDGPFPPFNDALVHHYVFTLFAMDIDRLPVEGDFTGAQVREALAGHVLGAATLSGTYCLNARLRDA
jgi:hypothetical protein